MPTTTNPTVKSNSMMLSSTVILFALIASFILSADAIRCHQCNSHLEEDCSELRLNTPRAPRDDQYLKECDGENSLQAFCRKTLTQISLTGERRIVRECGWLKDVAHVNNTCINADNEGFMELICNCNADGCNAAPSHLAGSSKITIFTLSSFSMLLAAVLRRSA